MHLIAQSAQLSAVKPDAEFECMGVLMTHSQDVKCVAWHPTEEVNWILFKDERL